MPERRSLTPVIAAVLFVVLAAAALAPVRSYDYFWHLAAGRWITEHRALPFTDPLAVASDRVPWINGEWLFEVIACAVPVRAAGAVRTLFVAALFTATFLMAARQGIGAALFLTLLAFAASPGRLDARPSTVAAAMVAAAIVLLTFDADRRVLIGYVVLTILWINIHPSALLAPVLAAIRAAAGPAITRRRIALPIASAAALLVNPFGYRAISAPIELTRYAASGAFVNSEWLPSRLTAFPLLYLSIAAGLVAFLVTAEKDERIWRFVIFTLLAWLAIAHVRNQGLYLAAFPLLVAPLIRRDLAQRLFTSGAVVLLAFALARGEYHDGIDGGRFPVAAVARLKQTNLPGNIYNPDQFGGFLIWSFYPERRTLTDGRNELYRTYIPEYARARLDSRAWHALLQKYRIDLAVDEYRGPIDVVDGSTGQHRAMPASLAYWPRRQWALIGYDPAAMVFARRAAFPAAMIERWEISNVVPDAR